MPKFKVTIETYGSASGIIEADSAKEAIRKVLQSRDGGFEPGTIVEEDELFLDMPTAKAEKVDEK